MDPVLAVILAAVLTAAGPLAVVAAIIRATAVPRPAPRHRRPRHVPRLPAVPARELAALAAGAQT
ncbi:hypothetical protein [Glycomyces paridis]|uniref:Uncharacterized protein n=1 Tax=Glycomyces paridis TaxID=2126555 RepID=A0A4S8PE68_9ACTN|nr:hypothetical protein [Glycomyces paridis]THV27915.1 hypothetical protein E9998_13060 [Glycomyces paridis]